mmetsp:Transcript_20375/g.36441  ORF Transcript_20375/g.36441 Transcript_20375/m.36441 type:complete len:653 (+) Transcript_20375:36-1994(+)
MASKGSELAKILSRRRREVEWNGYQFTKDGKEGRADCVWDEHHDSQFTPRSSRGEASRAPSRSPLPSPRQAAPRVAPEKPLAHQGPGIASRPRRLSATAAKAANRITRNAFGIKDVAQLATDGLGKGAKDAQLESSTAKKPAEEEEQDKAEDLDAPRVACMPPASPAGSVRSCSTASTVSCEASPTARKDPSDCPVTLLPTLLASENASAPKGTQPERIEVPVPALELSVSGEGGIASSSASTIEVDEAAPSPVSSLHSDSTIEASDAGLWQAVTQGEVAKLEEIADKGVLRSGRMQDGNGHSIFWNAVAFQQPLAALFLLERFPPGVGTNGVDLSEAHAQRQDTLLHLCIYIPDFSVHAAELFQKILTGCSGNAPHQAVNRDGQTFLHIAAARMNFWVLRFVLTHSPDWAPALWAHDAKGQTPLDVLLQKVSQAQASPAAPAASWDDKVSLPPWMDFGKYAPCGDHADLADVELEVQDSGEQGGTCRIMAHRLVLGANSGVLHALLANTAPGRPFLIDPLCCRSKKVLETALVFIYQARLSCDFAEDGFLLWQLLCLCAKYDLPAPLTRFARSAILRTLVDSRFAPLTPVLIEASVEVGLTPDEACFVACALLRSPKAALGTDGAADVLLAALAEVERHILMSHGCGLEMT